MRTVLLALLLLAAALPARAQGSFTSLGGPPGGRIEALVAHPSGSVAMQQDGRVFCSFDDGQTWAMPSVFADQPSSTLQREGDALLSTTTYSNSQAPHTFLSPDGCRSWRDVTGQDTRRERAVKGADGWFVRGDDGRLLRSTDGGATWQSTDRTSQSPPQATGSGEVFAIALDPSYSNYPLLLRWSADSTKWTPLHHFYGAYFARLSVGPGGALATEAMNPFTHLLRLSYDGGRSWPVQADADGSYAYTFDAALTFYAATDYGLQRKPRDGAWQQAGPDSSQYRAVAVLSSGTVIAARCGGVCAASTLLRRPAGGVWTDTGPEQVTAAVVAVATGNGRLVATHDSGVYERMADGRWQRIGAQQAYATPYLSPYTRLTTFGLLIAPWGTVYQAVTQVAIPTAASFGKTTAEVGQGAGLIAYGDSTMLAVSPWRTLLRSTNRGRTWTALDSVQATGLVRLGTGRIVAATERSPSVRWSDDGGATWASPRAFSPDAYASALALAAWPGTSTVWAQSATALRRSDDGGETWRSVGKAFSPPLSGYEKLALAATSMGRLVRASLRSSDPQTGLYVETSADGGATWVPVLDPQIGWRATNSWGIVPVRAPVALLPDGRLVLPARDGGLLVSAWPVANDQAEVADAAPGLSVFPNPARSVARVRVAAVPGAMVRVEVFDVLGRRIATLHDGAASGAIDLRLDASALPAGVYLVRATAGTTVHTRPLLVR